MVVVLLFYGMVVSCWSGWYIMIKCYSDGTATVYSPCVEVREAK